MIAYVFLIDDQDWKKKVEKIADKNGRPIFEFSSKTFVEDLMQKQQDFTFCDVKQKKNKNYYINKINEGIQSFHSI